MKPRGINSELLHNSPPPPTYQRLFTVLCTPPCNTPEFISCCNIVISPVHCIRYTSRYVARSYLIHLIGLFAYIRFRRICYICWNYRFVNGFQIQLHTRPRTSSNTCPSLLLPQSRPSIRVRYASNTLNSYRSFVLPFVPFFPFFVNATLCLLLTAQT